MASFPPLFRDLGKNANELLNKGYPSTDRTALRIELDSTSANGVQLSSTLSHPTGKAFEGEIKAKFQSGDALFTATANGREDVSLEVGSQRSYGNLKPSLSLISNYKNLIENLRLKPAVEIRTEYGNVNGSLELPLNRGSSGESDLKENLSNYPRALVSGVIGYRECGFSLGADVELSPVSNLDVKVLNNTLSYIGSDLEIALYRKQNFALGQTTVGASFFQRISNRWKDAAIASEIAYNLSSNRPPVLSLGGLFRTDDLSLVKTRINTNGLLGVSFTQRWGGPMNVTFLGDVNVLDSNAANAVQWGLKLSVR